MGRIGKRLSAKLADRQNFKIQSLNLTKSIDSIKRKIHSHKTKDLLNEAHR